MEKTFDKWANNVISSLKLIATNQPLSPPITPSPSSEEILFETSEEDEDDYKPDMLDEIGYGSDKEGTMDLEDLGTVASKISSAKASRIQEESEYALATGGPKRVLTEGDAENKPIREPKEMVTPMLRSALEKQGYKLIGSHSGVKICRWTKAMLRGRGGCYKHTFYGIQSHRCMETTPSLACANKCVFCWRHHTNPVGTEWRWKMDSPDLIVNGAIDNHVKMINQLKGVPGLLQERFKEAMTVKHCALSLVGECFLLLLFY